MDFHPSLSAYGRACHAARNDRAVYEEIKEIVNEYRQQQQQDETLSPVAAVKAVRRAFAAVTVDGEAGYISLWEAKGLVTGRLPLSFPLEKKR